MVGDDGRIRPQWSTVHAALEHLGPDGMRRQDARIRRTLHGHGTTFQIHGDGDPTWSLDPVPVVLERDEWNDLAAGIEQRARLLDAVLADLHGPRRLLRGGVLPAEALLRSEDYLRACVDAAGTSARLVFHAADVVRRRDGSFAVLADRCEAPSGAGYALENREVLARAYPALVRQAGVRRLIDWFDAVHDALSRLAPEGVDDPRIVLHTGGPTSRTYFEHSFLARSLGYSLVESGDLTVRGGHVFVKSVGGLEPVHVILRRVAGSSADPLELDAGEQPGVPGLVEAARRGNVAVANPVGSAIAGSPALLPHVAALCRSVLGEEPLLQTVPTWWCGDAAGLDHVLGNLDRMVLKPIDRTAGRTVFGSLLSGPEQDLLRRRVAADRHRWVGQEEVELPTSPGLASTPDGPALRPRLTLLRTFAVADADGGFQVMEGALARSGSARDRITIFEGGSSKDTWVVDPEGGRPLARMRHRLLPQIDLRDSVTSRVAESMFWLGRNLERSEAVVRLVLSVDRYLEQWPELAGEADGQWVRTVEEAVVGVVGASAPHRQPSSTQALLRGAVADRTRPRSLATSLRFLLLGARTVRELFSTDSWRLLTELDEVALVVEAAGEDQVIDAAAAAITPLAGLAGLFTESMVRDPGWRFLDAGRRLERALLVGGFLRSTMAVPLAGWIAAPMDEMVLSAWESLVAYRRRHRSDIEPSALLSLLVLDPSNPRSMRAAVDQLAADLAALPSSAPEVGPVDGAASAAVAEARRLLDGADADRLAAVLDGRRAGMERLVTEVHGELLDVGDALSRQYFTHVRSTSLAGSRTDRGLLA